MILTKICMPLQRRLQSLDSYVVFGGVGTLGLKGGLLCWCWKSCPGKALPGAAEAAPARVLPRESTSPSCSSCLLVLTLLRSLRASAPLSYPAQCGRGHGYDCPC